MDTLASIDWGVMFRPEYRAMLLKGIQNTLGLTAGAIVGGLLLGMVVAFGRLASSRWIRLPATVYVELVRTIPLLAHVLFWYFAVPEMLPDGLRRTLYQHDVGFYASLVALVLYSAAFISEDIRSGIRGIATGQAEAAHSLGFGFFDTFRLVVLPQALRLVVWARVAPASTWGRAPCPAKTPYSAFSAITLPHPSTDPAKAPCGPPGAPGGPERSVGRGAKPT